MTEVYVPTPCVRICRMDKENEICIGCLRTRDEIMAWPDASSEARLKILDAISTRHLPGRIKS